MDSPEQNWWSVRAGEYVLGTLRGKDLALFEQILAHDTTVQSDVARWEQRLAGLNEISRERVPGPHVWPNILDRVRQDETKREQSVSETLPNGRGGFGAKFDEQGDPDVILDVPVDHHAISGNAASTHSDGIGNTVENSGVATITPIRQSRFWPTVAGLATAASVVLGVLLFQSVNETPSLPLRVDGLAVVLSDESGKPYFLVETDYGNLRVRVTALAPPSLDDTRDFQLWQALPDRSSVRPVALLPEEPGTSSIFVVDSLIDGSDLFGVSIEPVGAETKAGPTGPVVAHGDFLPKRDID